MCVLAVLALGWVLQQINKQVVHTLYAAVYAAVGWVLQQINMQLAHTILLSMHVFFDTGRGYNPYVCLTVYRALITAHTNQ